VKKGDLATEMYFILDGKVQIVNEEGKVQDMISQGGFFGEIGLLKQVARTASVRVGTNVCTLLVLSQETVKSLLTEYPEGFQIIALESEKRTLKVEERNVSESLMSSSELGKFVVKPSSHTVNEFTDGIKVNRKERISLSRMFKGKGSAPGSGSRQLPTIESKMVKDDSSASLDSIVDPEPKKGMSVYSGQSASTANKSVSEQPQAPPVISNQNVSSTEATQEKSKNTIGKLFSSIRNTLSKSLSKSSHRIGSIKSIRVSDNNTSSPDISTSVVEHILDLQDSDMAIIFSLVDPIDLMRLQRVCRKWSVLFKQSFMWKSLDLRRHFRIVNKETLPLLAQLAGSNLQKLDLGGCWEVSDDDIKTISVCCPSITILSLSNCWKISDVGLTYVAKSIVNLKELDLSYCGQLSCTGLLNHGWSQMEKFNFSFCKQLGDEHLEALLSKTTKITSLEFRRCNRVTDFGLFLVVRYCRYILNKLTLDI
jgi:F-box/leucine-rich repeat protein 7